MRRYQLEMISKAVDRICDWMWLQQFLKLIISLNSKKEALINQVWLTKLLKDIRILGQLLCFLLLHSDFSLWLKWCIGSTIKSSYNNTQNRKESVGHSPYALVFLSGQSERIFNRSLQQTSHSFLWPTWVRCPSLHRRDNCQVDQLSQLIWALAKENRVVVISLD